MTQDSRTVFISHPDKASDYASRAKAIFEEHGYRTWLWDHDRPARGDLDTVLFSGIQRSDYFAHICTTETRRSKGQENERRFAKVLGKKPFVLLVFRPRFLVLFKQNTVPRDVDHNAMYNPVTSKTFDEDCRRAVGRLLREQELTQGPSEVGEGEPISATLVASAAVSVVGHLEKGSRA